MGFVKTYDEILAAYRETADFFDARMLTVFWETRPEIVERLLPAPLKPAADPIAMAFVAFYPETNFGVTYHESALFLKATFNGEEGNYCLAMPVTDGIAMAGGREIYGFPKKMADIHLSKDNDEVGGWTERRGVRFMEIKARLTGSFNDAPAQEKLMSMLSADGKIRGIAYNFKHFPAPEGGAFDYNPRLVRQETILGPKLVQFGEASVVLTPSEFDPWAEVEVVKVLGAIYTEGDNSMLKGSVVAEVDFMQFAPYAFLKWDM
jgi:acetoacetate decarboxylase